MSDAHSAHDGHEINAHTDALLSDPGMHDHHWRPTDVDPAAERRAERQVATLFVLSGVCSVLFVVAYFGLSTGYQPSEIAGMGASNVCLGLAFGFALLFIGIGIIQWARKLMADEELAEDRHPAASSLEDRSATIAAFKQGVDESGITRRPLIRNTLLGAVGFLLVPVVVELRDLSGTNPNKLINGFAAGNPLGQGLTNTIWRRGTRIVRDVVGTPIRPGDLEIGDLVNAEPELLFNREAGQQVTEEFVLEGADLQNAKEKAATVLLKMNPSDIVNDVTRQWSYEGIVAYSKICTHVGCPISLLERTTHHLLCPCHQSTFDLADGGKVVFGPAGHHLPQLPLGVDADGYLVALDDYQEPVGPSYWERDTQSVEKISNNWKYNGKDNVLNGVRNVELGGKVDFA
ncbi:cytochrome bc1 complex Rieske iron-sulfur subunit [Nocardioides baekrokdamisoli]|uniref:Cytochrome bc1 complex Rieske iron-sulfur subunit n=1 Tax=Nocardioides baekrokdamisoli TaxID=1804624 RepID=A0A3G9IX63_9ACTN|nr:Rieske 2Fe-2S domain-containing protein [Nocardioides baekrokdamisoli]BBH18281.1 cytochrome bc1 complex Rieske iron-sulfur subunit [Nocardioides baekrokdamisoli]